MTKRNFISILKSEFSYHMDDTYDNYFVEVFKEKAGTKEITNSFVKELKKVEFNVDVDDIRLSTDEDYNPGPYILIGVPVDLGDQPFSLIPGLVGIGSANRTALMGVVTQGENYPDHSSGYLLHSRAGVSLFKFEILSETTDMFYGDFQPPKELKGFRIELTKALLTTFLGYLSYAIGSAFLNTGSEGFEACKDELSDAIQDLWQDFHKGLANTLNYL